MALNDSLTKSSAVIGGYFESVLLMMAGLLACKSIRVIQRHYSLTCLCGQSALSSARFSYFHFLADKLAIDIAYSLGHGNSFILDWEQDQWSYLIEVGYAVAGALVLINCGHPAGSLAYHNPAAELQFWPLHTHCTCR